MIRTMSKRLISLLLVAMMLLSVMPLQVFALAAGDEESEHQHMDINPFEESVLLKKAKAEMDAILDKYLGARVMPREEVEEAIWSMDEDMLISAWEEAQAFAEMVEPMTDAEVYFIKLYESTETMCAFYEILSEIFNPGFALFAATGTHTPVTGVTVGVSGASDNSMSSGAITVTAKGSGGIFGIGASSRTATVTVYNEAGATATLSFDWTASSVNELKIDGTKYTGTSGSFSKVMDAGESFTITITTAKNSTTNKLVMKNFGIVVSKNESDVTFAFDSALGSVTVGGSAVNSGDVLTISKDGVTVAAAPASGTAFLGWIDTATHKILSKDKSFSLQPADDMTVMPVFASASPWFLVNGDYLYEGLNEAMTAVGSVANKTVVLANNATLPAGNYTIPAGVTLLIPFDAVNTLYTTAPGTTDAAYKTPTLYRTLTMASGAHIAVNGAISVSAMQTASGGLSAPTASTGIIKMGSDSSITVNSGANLYAWGFIIGSGSVTVKKGGTVYECFQVTGWRGGDNTSSMVDNKQGVFPMNQYYVQNVEVPMTLEAGATENGYMSVAISLIGIQGSAVPFIGSNGMFNILSGSLTKDYDETTDRLKITIDGEIGMQSLSISMKLGLLGTKTINSQKYELPVTNNLTVIIKDGGNVTITQDIAILPGAEMIVEKGGVCELGSGYNIYVYDADDWGNYAYGSLETGKKVVPVKYAPGKPASVPFHTADADAHIHIAGTIDASKGNVYVTSGGANITGEDGAVIKLNHAGTQTETYQVTMEGSDGKTLKYSTISIKPVGLVENETGVGGKYEYTNGAWVKTECTHRYAETTSPAGCENGGLKTFTCPCGDTYTQAIPATGHTEVIDKAIAPTCTQTGLTEGKHCSVCGKVLVAQEVVEALGHDYKSVVTDPTCTEGGYTTYTCSVCGDSYVGDKVEALGHNYAGVVTKPTCTEGGYTTYTCSVCGDSYVGNEVAALGHDYTGADASCTAAKTCTVCGAELEAALGHNYIDVVTEPTCTENGFTTYTCSRCGDSYVDDYVDAKGHTPGKNATCTEPQTCTACGKVLNPAGGHVEAIDPAKAPTCTQTGLTEGKHCSICGEVLVAQQVVAKNAHSYKTVVTEPTCTEQGYTTYTCSECTDTYIDDYTDVIAHSYAGVVTKPTCTEGGYTTYTCSACGDNYVADKVEALGHDYKSVVTAPTCTAQGYTTYTCSVCGDTYVSDYVPVKAHIPGEEATCITSQICTVCGTVLVEELGHKWQEVPAKAPGRTENGYESYKACEECGEIDGEIVIIPAIGEAVINTYEEFIFNLTLLEEIAGQYAKENPGKNPIALVIKYIRTGVDRYNSGSWGIMAGYEDVEFAKYVKRMEDMANAEVTDGNYVAVTGLKNINNFYLPNGDRADIGHVFGAMDITYHNKGSQNHADVSGWAGDLVDLLEVSDMVGASGSLDAMIKFIAENTLGKQVNITGAPSMSQEDIDGDLDAYYVMYALYEVEEDYSAGLLTEILMNYFTEDLTTEQRAAFFLRNRLETTGTRAQVRNAVYTEYTSNKMIATLEGTREFKTKDLSTLRRAVCYAFADYVCKLAGDYVEKNENIYYEVFNSSMSVLAPGITQEYYQATSADGKQMVYYVATADITRDDVHVFANYHNAAPEDGWAMQRVLDQANAAQNKYGDPSSPDYIPNYNVIVSTNADGYNMSTGEPGGLLVMNGKEWHGIDKGGFFGITKDGKAVIGTKDEYNNIYKDQVAEAVGGFGTMLIKDGKIVVAHNDNYTKDRAPRTAIGITKTGKVVIMVLDGRQEPYSCGGSMQEIAQILFEAGCVTAVNLDGGGSSTFVAKQQGEDELAVMNRPSDGAARSVSTSLLMVSTAPSSTAFDHANLVSAYNYATIGTPVQLTPVGISATGNITDLPEGYTWAVSDERWATVTEDGLFTGLRNGAVDVYLMLDGNIVGSKTMNIVVPESIYFTKKTVDAIYGSDTALPIAALYEGKQVAINAGDVTLALDNAKAGALNGFTFTATEGTGIKVVKITATLIAEPSIAGSVTVNLYRQGENTFDFDKATGGDRLLAWDRVVSNTTTSDGMSYFIVEPGKDMTATYTFAMDMTQIQIPARLADLVYMLPGADMEDASAWNFLLQLAERVSTLTEVTPVMQFDPNVKVDYSGLTIKTDYFELVGTEFDEATNTLKLKLSWIDQTSAIDPSTANPICLLGGIKVTPKDDASWDSNNRLNVVNKGTVSYKIYLRANALYSFAQKPENQEIFGLMPFVNPNLPSESGAYFGDIYKQFEDNYTLANSLKNGWVAEDGGFAYYIEGVRMAGGIKKVEGYYYEFDDNGINRGQTKYTGIFYSSSAGAHYYSKNGTLEGGWQSVDGEWYYFDKTTLKAISGTQKLNGVTYEFESNGKLKSGVWVNVVTGMRYYYGPSYYMKKWQNIDGSWYYFRDGLIVTGMSEATALDNTTIRRWYDFGEDGIAKELDDGLYTVNDKLYYIVDGIKQVGLHKVDGDYYFFTYDGPAICGKSYYAWETHCDLPCDTYAFGFDGKMVDGLAQMEDGIYYYVNGKVNWQQAGLHKIGDDYYFINTAGKCITGASYYAWATYCDLPCGNYEFDADGKMLQGIVEKADGHYYYVNGKIDWTLAGLHNIGGDYYFINTAGKCITGAYYAWATFCDLPCGNYEFGADGKMLQGIVEKEDGNYYYVNGQIDWKLAGLHNIDGDYYFVNTAGKCITGAYYAWATFCDLPCGNYEFGADGKMLQGIIEKEDGHYYYVNGQIDWKSAGLHKIGDDYYFVNTAGKCITGAYYAWETFCDLPCGNYEFGEDGKMFHGFIEREDGIYCYVNGKPGSANPGLAFIDGYYYFINTAGKCVTGTYYAWATNCDLPIGTYEFDEQGRMLDGFIEKADGIYYYENGKIGKVGVNYIDGYYYFLNTAGKLVTNQVFWVWETNGLILETHYVFNELGQIVGLK